MPTEHVHEEPFRFFSYMALDMVIRSAAFRAIKKCHERLSETGRTLHTDYGVQAMFFACASAVEEARKTLDKAEETLHRVGGAYCMDQWLGEQPEWLQHATANEVCGWVDKTFGELQ